MHLHRVLMLAAALVAVAPASAEAALIPAPLASVSASEALHQVVVSPDGVHIFGVVRGAGVMTFRRDAAGRPTPAGSVAVASAREIALAPDGKDLYVVAQDGEEDGALSHFRVGANGSLTYAGCYGLPTSCGPSGFDEFTWPNDIEVSPDGRDVYVLSPGVQHYKRDATGVLSYVSTAKGARMDEPHAFAMSPDGRNLYSTSGAFNVFRESRISRYRRDPATGAVVYAGCTGTDFNGGPPECVALPAGVASTSGPAAIVVSPDSGHVYTAGWSSSSNEFEGIAAVTHFTVGSDGALTFADCIGNGPSGCVPLPAGTYELKHLRSLAVHPGGRDLYVNTIGTDTITHFTLGAGGELGFGSCIGHTPAPACTITGYGSWNAQGVATSPDGKNLYGVGVDDLHAFSLGPAKAPPVGTPASIELLGADEPTQFGGSLNARIHRQGAPHYAVRWEYGPTTAYGLFRDGGSTYDDGGGWTGIETSLRDLAPGTTYHYRLVVNTPAGAVYSPDATFTTKPYAVQYPPSVWSHPALGNAGTAVAFAATVRGSGVPTRFWFEWGETQEYGRVTPARELSVADGRTHSVRELVSGLEPGKQYYYRVVAENAAGRAVGFGSGVRTYTGPTTPAGPQPSPSPTPDPDPDPSPTPDPGPSPTIDPEPSADLTPTPDPPSALSPSSPRALDSPASRSSSSKAPVAPRVSVSKRRIVVSVTARTRIVIERRQGRRWVRVTAVTTRTTYRRTVKPGLYRVTAGTAKRQVRVR